MQKKVLHCGCVVVQLVALLPCSKKVMGLTPSLGSLLHGVCMFSLWMHGFYLGTPASSHSMTVRFIGLSKLPLVMSVCMIVCPVCLCCPTMERQPVQGLPRLSSVDLMENRHQIPRDPVQKKQV
ncbi:hypothetical protein ILYODFUR_019723 [Ilyodon furcidens]|uniref:Uncharacterized protein n=1 Tax=Ilyodon furcidens TaxID=33524 RepID=A0ABV0U8M5_9TELE